MTVEQHDLPVLEPKFGKKSTSLFEKEVLTSGEVGQVIQEVFAPFIQVLTDKPLREYQMEVACGIAHSLLSGNGYDITILQARQSGKSETVAQTVLALGFLVPKLVEMFKCKTFRRFNQGFRVGIFGPSYDKAAIIYTRIKDRLRSSNARAVLADPELGMDPKDVKGLRFPNGFCVDLKTANKGADVEGPTFDLVIVDEAQRVDDYVLKKSIRPMLSSTYGSMVMVGTPEAEATFFGEMCFKNQENDLRDEISDYQYRRHYEFDWTYVAACDENYKKTVQREMEVLGKDSVEFRLAYKLEWIEARSKFFARNAIRANGIAKSTENSFATTKNGEKYVSTFRRPAGLTSYDNATENQVFSVDWASHNDSTVVTVGRVWWENPYHVGEETRYPIHIHDWIEFSDMRYNEQVPAIVEALKRYSVKWGIDDCTGVGDPAHDFLAAELSKYGITLFPFETHMNRKKENGYKLLDQEWSEGRITYPASEKVKTYGRHKKFVKEMSDLVREFKNGYMKVHAPTGDSYHDDYPASLMMLCWLVNKETLEEGRVQTWGNPLRDARWNRVTPESPGNERGRDGRSTPKKRFWIR